MMKKIYTLAIVLLVLGVSSCKLGKHYSRPELRLPEQIEGTVPDSVSAGDTMGRFIYRSGTPAVDPENIGRKQRPDDRCGQSERIDGTPSYR